MAVVITGSTITAPAGAIDAADLTGDLDASLLTGTLPALDGSALTGVGGSTTLGAVGTYAMLKNTVNTERVPGETVSASLLYYTSGFGSLDTPPTSPSGTWQLMGYTAPYGDGRTASVFLRIS